MIFIQQKYACFKNINKDIRKYYRCPEPGNHSMYNIFTMPDKMNRLGTQDGIQNRVIVDWGERRYSKTITLFVSFLFYATLFHSKLDF